MVLRATINCLPALPVAALRNFPAMLGHQIQGLQILSKIFLCNVLKLPVFKIFTRR